MDLGNDESRAAHASALASDYRALIGKLRRRMREQGDAGDLTPSQVSALLRLEKEGAHTASSLARAEGMRPQSMATVVAALDAAGLIGGAPDPTDGRRVLLTLTGPCRAWLSESRAVRQDWLSRRLQARLSNEELDLLDAAAVLLRRLVDD